MNRKLLLLNSFSAIGLASACMAPLPGEEDQIGGGHHADIEVPPGTAPQRPREMGSLEGTNRGDHVPFTQPPKRPRPSMSIPRLSMVIGALTVLVPSEALGGPATEMSLAEVLNIRPVQNGNFEISGLLEREVSTPWARLPDFTKIEVLQTVAKKLDEAGYGFDAEYDDEGNETAPAQSVWHSFRLNNRGGGGPRPRLYVNRERFNPEDARALAQFRKVLAEGDDDEKAAAVAAVKKVTKPQARGGGDVEL